MSKGDFPVSLNFVHFAGSKALSDQLQDLEAKGFVSNSNAVGKCLGPAQLKTAISALDPATKKKKSCSARNGL